MWRSWRDSFSHWIDGWLSVFSPLKTLGEDQSNVLGVLREILERLRGGR